MENQKFLGSWVIGFLCALFLVGCSKPQSDSDRVRRAQLVGNENLQLKKDIVDKDKQIAELAKQAELAKADLQQANATVTKQVEQAKADLTKQLEQLKQDNESLKKQYTESQQNHENVISEFQENLKACQQSLEAAPTPCPEVEEKYGKLYGDLLKILSECATKLEKYEMKESEAGSPETK